MSYQRLKQALAKKLRRTERRLYQVATDLARTAPMSTRDAMYVLALQQGIDIRKYADEETIDRVRQLKAAAAYTPAAAPARPDGRRRARPAQRAVAQDIKPPDPLVTKRVVQNARLMGNEVYPMLYLFENSVRQLIRRVMSRAHGSHWWPSKVPPDIVKIVAQRMRKEERNAWHGQRVADPIYYTDMDHLKRIVMLNWDDFAELFPNQAWFENLFHVISISRNVAHHHNPLAKQDITGLEVYTAQWHRQLSQRAAGRLGEPTGIPEA